MILPSAALDPEPVRPAHLRVGIFKLRWYGTLIAIGILIAGWLASA